MVTAPVASVSNPVVTPPSMGPPSVSYIPPITLEEAVIRARVRLRRRAKGAARGMIVALVLFSLPLLQAVAALFPSDPAAKVSSWAYTYCALLSATFLFLGLATYRIMTDRPTLSYGILGVGAALILFYAITVWNLVQAYLTVSAQGFADANTLLLAVANPVLGLAAGVVMVVAASVAIPRAVPIAESA